MMDIPHMTIRLGKFIIGQNVEEVTISAIERGKGVVSTYRASNPSHQLDTIIQKTSEGVFTHTRTLPANDKVPVTEGWQGVDSDLVKEAHLKMTVARSLFQTRWGNLQEALQKGGLRNRDKVESIEGGVGKVDVACRRGELGELVEVTLSDGLTQIVVQDPAILKDIEIYNNRLKEPPK
jgi:hypothetical protein